MESKKCILCEREFPITEYQYFWKSGSKTIGKCRSCLSECNRERFKLKREAMGLDVEIRSLPNTYRNNEQRLQVFEFLELLGWNFNEEKGIWYKDGIKNEDGKFTKFKEKPQPYTIPNKTVRNYTFVKPEGYVHRNQGKTKLSKDQFKELYEMRMQGYTYPQLMKYYNLSQPTLMKYINYYYENKENEDWGD